MKKAKVIRRPMSDRVTARKPKKCTNTGFSGKQDGINDSDIFQWHDPEYRAKRDKKREEKMSRLNDQLEAMVAGVMPGEKVASMSSQIETLETELKSAMQSGDQKRISQIKDIIRLMRDAPSQK